MSNILENMTNPSNKEKLEDQMSRIKEDPTLKPILDEIETGGPSAMMKYVMLIFTNDVLAFLWTNVIFFFLGTGMTKMFLKNLAKQWELEFPGKLQLQLKFLALKKQKKLDMRMSLLCIILLVLVMLRYCG